MRTIVIIAAMMIALPTAIQAKKRNIATEDKANFGFKVEQMTTGSGHGSGYTVNAQLNKGRKGLEVGFIYNNGEEKIAGGDFRYKLYMGSPYRVSSNKKAIKPYLQYNLVYQKGLSSGNELVTIQGIEQAVETEPGMVATVGHYLGYGNKVKLFDRAYIDSSIGFGMYQGSLDKVNGPGTVGYHNNNFGLTYSFKIGFGYTFN